MVKATTFDLALQHSGTVREKELFNNPQLLALLEPHVIAYQKLTICARNWNTDATTGKVWEPDWNNHSQYKYFPWMQVKASEQNPAGFGFSLSLFDLDYSFTIVGSRLCFEKWETAVAFGKTFADLYKEFWLIPTPSKTIF